MLAKQACRLINKTNPLVTNSMKARYYADTDFLDAGLGANPSFMWRSIMAAQGVVKQNCRRKIGDGRSTRVWQIPWLPCCDNGFPTTVPHEELKDILVHNLMTEDQKAWDVDVLNDLFNDRDRALIQQIPIPSRSRPDPWYWPLDDKGVFTAPRRVEFLNTFATELWKKIGLQDIIPGDESVTVLQILLNAFRTNNRDKRALVGLFCWGIWFRRNTWVWDKRSISVFGVQSMAMQLLQDWRRNQEQNEDSDHRNQRARTSRWCKPQEGWIKVNIDAACHHQLEFIGMGCVARDDSGRFLRARSERMQGGMSPREAEAWSFRAALSWMKLWKTQR
ncbi:uncharacterized protein LOC141720247 [Apium graveolens]|uniref:uncharacterized protein LOC141720247 n=1 Tax=Apium graveolens TaxID=4045 RepID=UPI003D794941